MARYRSGGWWGGRRVGVGGVFGRGEVITYYVDAGADGGIVNGKGREVNVRGEVGVIKEAAADGRKVGGGVIALAEEGEEGGEFVSGVDEVAVVVFVKSEVVGVGFSACFFKG